LSKYSLRIHESNRDGSVRFLAHDHVARQQESDVGIGLDRTVGAPKPSFFRASVTLPTAVLNGTLS
jgi:hypothetical protein